MYFRTLALILLLFSSSLIAPKSILAIERPPKKHTVVIEKMKFNPPNIEVHKGDTIVFINKGFVAHDVTEKNDKWASPKLKPGDSWKMVAQKSSEYYCSIHVVMKGKVTVK